MYLDYARAEWAYFTGAFVTLLFIIDPFAAVPIFLSLTERFNAADRRHIQAKATMSALLMLAVFAVSGMGLFHLFGITLPAFQIAGGLLLLQVGVSQLNATRRKVTSAETAESQERDDVSIFPLATPLLAGPGAISTVVLFSTKASSVMRQGELLVALTCCMAVAYVVLRSAPYLHRLLGTTGLTLLSRVMGIVLTAVGVQFILNGLHEVVPRLFA